MLRGKPVCHNKLNGDRDAKSVPRICSGNKVDSNKNCCGSKGEQSGIEMAHSKLVRRQSCGKAN